MIPMNEFKSPCSEDQEVGNVKSKIEFFNSIGKQKEDDFIFASTDIDSDEVEIHTESDLDRLIMEEIGNGPCVVDSVVLEHDECVTGSFQSDSVEKEEARNEKFNCLTQEDYVVSENSKIDDLTQEDSKINSLVQEDSLLLNLTQEDSILPSLTQEDSKINSLVHDDFLLYSLTREDSLLLGLIQEDCVVDKTRENEEIDAIILSRIENIRISQKNSIINEERRYINEIIHEIKDVDWSFCENASMLTPLIPSHKIRTRSLYSNGLPVLSNAFLKSDFKFRCPGRILELVPSVVVLNSVISEDDVYYFIKVQTDPSWFIKKSASELGNSNYEMIQTRLNTLCDKQLSDFILTGITDRVYKRSNYIFVNNRRFIGKFVGFSLCFCEGNYCVYTLNLQNRDLISKHGTTGLKCLTYELRLSCEVERDEWYRVIMEHTVE